jgi:hypothetical protein
LIAYLCILVVKNVLQASAIELLKATSRLIEFEYLNSSGEN